VIPLAKWVSSLSAQIDRYVVDGAVNAAGALGSAFARLSGWFDSRVVDGAVNLVAMIQVELSRGLRLIQTGRVQQYLLFVFFGLLCLVGAFVL